MSYNGTAYILYHYNPSLKAAEIFIVLFTAATVLHIGLLLKNWTWYFIPFAIGGIFEIGGYLGRAISAKQSPNWTDGPYILQSLTLLLAPALFAASIYMILGRVIRLLDAEAHSLIRTKFLTKIFVTGDVLSFFVQAGGGGMLANSKTSSSIKLGQNIITGGLIIQLLFFSFFITVTAVFHRRISNQPTKRSQIIDVPWRSYLWVIYAASLLIMVRSVFRVIEYVQGQNGPLLKTETYLYVFDAALMFLMMVLFIVFHPSKIISKKRDFVVDELCLPDPEAQNGGQALLETPKRYRHRSASQC